ncbi:MAG: exosortase/archaeosortase family protein [Planctomycetes bacterium]|nr:exosortase/archaeosortase family protein [Planctomycetota bacterium]
MIARVVLGVAAAAAVARSLPAVGATWGAATPAWGPPALALAALAVGGAAAGGPRPRARVGRGASLALGALLHAVGARAGDASLVAPAPRRSGLGAAALLWPRAGALWPAALLLAAATPPPLPVVLEVQEALKGAAARAASLVLSLGGTPAWSDGWVIRVPRGELRVVDACSGARTWLGLLVAAAVLLQARPSGPLARWTTLGACLPAAFLATVARLTVLGGALQAHGAGSTTFRALHEAAGLLVVVPGVVVLLAARRAAAIVEGEPSPSAPRRVAPAGPGRAWLAAAVVAAALGAGLLPPPACPCRPMPLPATLDGAPARAAEDLVGTAALEVDHLEARAYGDLTVVLAHGHGLGGRHGVHGRPPEWLTPLCHAAVAAEQVTLPGGLRARRLHLAREDGRRLALAVWLDAEGRPAAASLPGAWAAALLRGATGRPAGGASLMAWTDATGAGPERLAREEARFARLAAALGVVADASDPP